MTAPRDPATKRLAIGLLLAFLLAYGDDVARLLVAAAAFAIAALVLRLLARSLNWGRAVTEAMLAAILLLLLLHMVFASVR